jgi:CBS domain-containing protein
MLVSKGSGQVITVTPETSVSDVTLVLSKLQKGSVVVSADGKTAVGILSERDIVRSMAMHGADIVNDPASKNMTSKLVTCSMGATADQVLKTMTDKRFRHMPVVVGGELVGIVTIGDVVKARMSELAMEKDALEGMIMGH